MMFAHAGLRPLWPVIAFLPWLVLGLGLLVYAATRKLRQLPSRAPQLHVVSVLTLAFLAAARVASADPAAPESRACEVSSAQEAASRADRLYQQGEYQRAGQCYQAAGDLVHANLAFLQAAGPAGEDSARGLKAQRDKAKTLFASVGRAFKGNH